MCKHFLRGARKALFCLDLKTLKSFFKAKKQNILIILIFLLLTGLFLSNWDFPVQAKNLEIKIKPNLDTVDPLAKIGESSLGGKTSPKICSENETILSAKSQEEKNKEAEYWNLVNGHPIETMIPAIAQKDKTVAAFLIGIAKKESDWGKHVPLKNGKDCYNYWGYRGLENPTDSGYSCFSSPEEAVSIVGGRIEMLLDKKINTPERMIVWKCGSTCAGHDPAGVRKWISDVSKYFYSLNS